MYGKHYTPRFGRKLVQPARAGAAGTPLAQGGDVGKLQHNSAPDSLSPAQFAGWRRTLAVPGALLGGTSVVVWLVTGSLFSSGLASCDYSARFSADDLKFQAVQVISGFPAFIDANTNTITRICGVPLRDDNGDLLPGETEKTPNGIELTINLVSTDPNNRTLKPKCARERDLSVKEGDRIESQPVTTVKTLQNIKPGQFNMTLDCYEPHATTSAKDDCVGGGQKSTLPAKAVYFRREALGCDEKKPDTFQSLAIVVDQSGSMSGFVSMDQAKCADSSKFAEELPGIVKNTNFKECRSDPLQVLVEGARTMIDQLNDQDRVVTLAFSEKDQVFVGCLDNLVCQDDGGQVIENTKCTVDDDCAATAKAQNLTSLHCGAHPDKATSTIPSLPLNEGLAACYGSAVTSKLRNKYGLEVNKYLANGRAAVYEALVSAYDFMKAAAPGAPDPVRGGNAKHILMLVDGPDTCTHNDNFLFTTFDQPKNPGGLCRQQCSFINVTYQELLKKMAQDRFPIHIHVIQIQSLGKLAPDPTLQELACRSQGTYQFINTASFNRCADQPSCPGSGVWNESITRAVLKVRYALAGQWRVGFTDSSAFGINGALKPGVMHAARGRLNVVNPLFPSLAEVFLSTEKEWRFELLDSERDARLPFRLACATDADCGDPASSECSNNSCGPNGLCRSAAAPDLLPCGKDGKSKCCGGKCASSCTGKCK